MIKDYSKLDFKEMASVVNDLQNNIITGRRKTSTLIFINNVINRKFETENYFQASLVYLIDYWFDLTPENIKLLSTTIVSAKICYNKGVEKK